MRLTSNDSACKKKVALVNWYKPDEVADGIQDELIALGYQPTGFLWNETFPTDADVVFSFAPWGRFLQIPRQIETAHAKQRPILVHWNTEDPPDPRIPWSIMTKIGEFRSWVDRLNDYEKGRALLTRFPFSYINRKMHKFRYVGDYYYAWRRRWIDSLFESSEIYAARYREHGMPAEYVPWGTSPHWYANLGIERDIDVLWFGKRRTKRRRELIDRVQGELSALGFQMCIIDPAEQPVVSGCVRNQLLNRAKITLNLLPTWYDNNFSFRFHFAAGNRSLVVSEDFLPHYTVYEADKHYVSTPAARLTETLVYYLEHANERAEIVENAYQLVTEKLTLRNSIQTIMSKVERLNAALCKPRLEMTR